MHATEDVARKIMCRLGLAGDELTSSLEAGISVRTGN
jgi:hypothetical protein